MDPAAVAAFYQAKGYSVREGARVPGLSGNEHKVPLLAEGPLGSLAIFFGDFGGVDGPEMGGARKAARDIGATPVLVADGFTNNDRQVAARLGVVLLDGSMMTEDAPAEAPPPQAAWPGLQVRPSTARDEPEQHPWPASGRMGGRDGAGAQAIDIDDLLAETRRPSPSAASPSASAPAPGSAEAVLAAMQEAPAPAASAADEGESLWRRPRPAPAGTAASPATGQRPRSRAKFAWLDAAPSEARAKAPGKAGGDGGQGDGFAVDYDDVVPARSAPQARVEGEGATRDEAPAPRLGAEADLQPTMEQLERKARRDKTARRVFWALFVFVFLYLFWLWWN